MATPREVKPFNPAIAQRCSLTNPAASMADIPSATRGIVYDAATNTYQFDYQPLAFGASSKGKRVNPNTGAYVTGGANANYYYFEAPVEPGVIYDLRFGTGALENSAYFCDNVYLGPFYNLGGGSASKYTLGEYSAAPLVPAGSTSNVVVLRASSQFPAADQYVYATQLYNDIPLTARVTALEQGGGAGGPTYTAGAGIAITGNVISATSSATPGTARDPFDVPTAKRKAVVDANAPAYLETDSAYYGKEFVDEVYGPGRPAYYKCMPSAPAQTGGATVWKWFRIDIL